MLNIPVLRWGKPYDSLEKDEVVHFISGEPIARVSQANGGLLQRDMRHAPSRPQAAARNALRRVDPADEAGRRSVSQQHAPASATARNRPTNSPALQSATTGLPEHMCKANMQKNFFVLSHMDQMLEALTRGLPLDILTRGYGIESRGVVVSFRHKRRRWDWCCRRIRPACTRCGCR